MKNIFIPVPEGYDGVMIMLPDEIAPLLTPKNIKCIKKITNGHNPQYVILDDTP